MTHKKRAIIMVIDACGVGSMPDYQNYEEINEANTLRSTCDYALKKMNGIKLNNLQKLGLANITFLPGLPEIKQPIGSWGKMSELNNAKDTITGHWEMVGIKAKNAFPYYPEGFPKNIIEEFKRQTGVAGILGNTTASGTEIINKLGDEHHQTGFPIIYTSADSVLQIACDVDVINLETQYHWCKIAREIMRGKNEVARIIARPFKLNEHHAPGSTKASEMKYVRLNDKRHDYSVLPHSKSILDTVIENQGRVIGLGKIQDIFAGVGVPENIHTKNNEDGLEKLINVLKKEKEKSQEVIFINLVETDANYGHRRDPEGFAKALEAIDKKIPEVLNCLDADDLFFITADHGCDPTAAGTDHTREYVPLIMYNSQIPGNDLGTRKTFADIGATILDWFKLEEKNLTIEGISCL